MVIGVICKLLLTTSSHTLCGESSHCVPDRLSEAFGRPDTGNTMRSIEALLMIASNRGCISATEILNVRVRTVGASRSEAGNLPRMDISKFFNVLVVTGASATVGVAALTG